jgi:calcineurin-like phosphoesterase family protein
MLYLTADLHFDHKSIIKYCNRPFRDVGEMNRTLVQNWNDRVTDRDIVFVLGDFTLKGLRVAERWFSELNGFIHVVPGCHDKRWLKDLETARFQPMSASSSVVQIEPTICEVKMRTYAGGIPAGTLPKVNIVMSHYAMRTWPKSHHGSWHLYGHSHGRLPHDGSLSLDVGVDAHDYKPVSVLEVRDILEHRSRT